MTKRKKPRRLVSPVISEELYQRKNDPRMGLGHTDAEGKILIVLFEAFLQELERLETVKDRDDLIGAFLSKYYGLERLKLLDGVVKPNMEDEL